MTDSPDYRLYLETKFSEINTHVKDQFTTINSKLDNIKGDTSKTNGRVTKLEDDVSELKRELDKHPSECTKSKDIDALKEDLVEYRFIKKYPKLTAILLAFFVVALLISAYGTFSTMRSNFNDKATRQTIDTINQNTK